MLGLCWGALLGGSLGDFSHSFHRASDIPDFMVNPRVNPDQMNQSYSLPTTSSKEALESESPTPSPYSKVHSSKIVLEKIEIYSSFRKKDPKQPNTKEAVDGGAVDEGAVDEVEVGERCC